MKRFFLITITAIIAAGMFMACKHNKEVVPIIVDPGPDTSTVPLDTSLCFERDILPVFISNCAKSGCHDAATHEEGYVFTSYATITAKKFYPGNSSKTELYKKIVTTGSEIMPPPPDPPLTAAQISLIKSWIDRGAPNTTNCASTCDSNSYTFSGAIKPMLDKYCKGCHNASTQSGGYSFDTYAGVKTAVDAGRLWGSVNHAAGYSAMPQGGNKLSGCQLKQIEKWIAAGANNN